MEVAVEVLQMSRSPRAWQVRPHIPAALVASARAATDSTWVHEDLRSAFWGHPHQEGAKAQRRCDALSSLCGRSHRGRLTGSDPPRQIARTGAGASSVRTVPRYGFPPRLTHRSRFLAEWIVLDCRVLPPHALEDPGVVSVPRTSEAIRVLHIAILHADIRDGAPVGSAVLQVDPECARRVRIPGHREKVKDAPYHGTGVHSGGV